MPILHVAGWYDCFLAGTLRSFATPRRAADRLIVGPWAHDSSYSHLVGERHLGVAGAGDVFGLGERVLDFYDAALAEEPARLAAGHRLPAGRTPLGGLRRLAAAGRRAADGSARPAPAPSTSTRPTSRARSAAARSWSRSRSQGMGARDQRPTAAREDVLALPVDGVEAGHRCSPARCGRTCGRGPTAARRATGP